MREKMREKRKEKKEQENERESNAVTNVTRFLLVYDLARENDVVHISSTFALTSHI